MRTADRATGDACSCAQTREGSSKKAASVGANSVCGDEMTPPLATNRAVRLVAASACSSILYVPACCSSITIDNGCGGAVVVGVVVTGVVVVIVVVVVGVVVVGASVVVVLYGAEPGNKTASMENRTPFDACKYKNILNNFEEKNTQQPAHHNTSHAHHNVRQQHRGTVLHTNEGQNAIHRRRAQWLPVHHDERGAGDKVCR